MEPGGTTECIALRLLAVWVYRQGHALACLRTKGVP